MKLATLFRGSSRLEQSKLSHTRSLTFLPVLFYLARQHGIRRKERMRPYKCTRMSSEAGGAVYTAGKCVNGHAGASIQRKRGKLQDRNIKVKRDGGASSVWPRARRRAG